MCRGLIPVIGVRKNKDLFQECVKLITHKLEQKLSRHKFELLLTKNKRNPTNETNIDLVKKGMATNGKKKRRLTAGVNRNS